jgi:cytochrome bd ubiquinol oxidase subunit I
MILDSMLLSRIQFAFTISFHILFPALNVGLALFLAIIEGRWLKTRDPRLLSICKFWSKIFALTFGMGVVSGVVLAYELGTNFGPFIQVAGGVIGALFIYEVLAAFFLEAGFLGVMLFGWDRVSPPLHFLATCMVALGTLISSLAIMAANSWMQTPTGFYIENGQYVVENWKAVIFNPSYLPMTTHMVVASWLTTCFFVAGVSAWHLLKKQHIAVSQYCFRFSLLVALGVSILQVFIGDLLGLHVHHTQPLKTAAVEAIWETQKGAPFLFFAIPDTKQAKNHYALGIPKLASLLNTHQLEGEMLGLKSVPPADRPPVWISFWMFRLMVGIGFLFVAIALYAFWLNIRGKLFQKPWFYRICVAASPLGFVAVIAGWLVTERGRQPWLIYQHMRTLDGISQLPWQQVLTSLILIVIIYSVVFTFYLHYLFKVIRKGPDNTVPRKMSEVITTAPFKYLAPEALAKKNDTGGTPL